MELKLKLEASADENGIPALFLQVVSTSGAVHTALYDGNEPIASLFKRMKDLVGNPVDSGYRPIMREEEPLYSKDPQTEKTMQSIFNRQPGEIKKRDVVKCVLSLPRDGGLPLQVGKEYTVISVGRMKDIEKDRMVKVFELNDLEHGRVMGFEEEVEFVRENPPAQAPRYDFFEETRVCDKCGEMYTVRKDKNTGELIGPFACGCISVKA